MNIKELQEKISGTSEQNTKLFFITRVYKENIRKSTKVMDKYLFKVYQVEVDSEIRKYLFDLSKEQLEFIVKKDFELIEYDVISDDTQHLFTYSMTNKALSFADVVNNQLNNKPPKITCFEEIISKEELWAYCIGFYDVEEEDWTYSFRKVLPSKVVIDEKDDTSNIKKFKFVRTLFDTKSQKLTLLKRETINLDKQIDCLYYNDTFYIIRKSYFEQIVGLEAEFKEKAEEVVAILEKCDKIVGMNVMKDEIEKNPSLHKKLVRISKIGNINNLDEKAIKKMAKISKQYGENFKIADGKIAIEDGRDIEQLLKLLADYYKIGEVSGKPYGTFAGKELKATVSEQK